jgi:GxxExxY protein
MGGCAVEVHRVLGPGLLESAYEPCLEWEFQQHGLYVRRQVVLPVVYKGIELKSDYRIDLPVEDRALWLR